MAKYVVEESTLTAIADATRLATETDAEMTPEEMAQALNEGAEEMKSAVKYIGQELTEEQQKQARENINVPSKEDAETWTFTLEDGSTVTKKVVLA